MAHGTRSRGRIELEVIETDIAIIGAGGAGLRAAIAAAQKAPQMKIALISKVYPMRSHTVAAEGGAAGVVASGDTLDNHFEDTVAGGDWLCDQDVVEDFVAHATQELIWLENMGCPWSRQASGEVSVRKFGGMKVPRTWFAADKSGFHILHTLYETSTQFDNIVRYDEHFVVDLVEDNSAIRGVLTYDLHNGHYRLIVCKAVVLCTGGAAQAYRDTTNATIVTGDGMSIAYRHGIGLSDMEFVQYHPTGLPGCGLLITEAARGEGGILVNKDGYRYLQDYGLGPETPLGHPENKTMELGPRDRLSQAFWHEAKKGRTAKTALGDVVYLDLRHLGRAKLDERLPQICELARSYVGVEPAVAPIPVRPVVHYTMGGIRTDIDTATSHCGVFAAGECACNGLHGANRLGSNSLTETLVYGHRAGDMAVEFCRQTQAPNRSALTEAALSRADALMAQFDVADQGQSCAQIRRELGTLMEQHAGIYRHETGLSQAVREIAALKSRYKAVDLKDKSGRVFNFELMHWCELGFTLDVAECMVHAALWRKESRGSHQRIDAECTQRDDDNFLCHSFATPTPNGAPQIASQPVRITKSAPGRRVYGGEMHTNGKVQTEDHDEEHDDERQ